MTCIGNELHVEELDKKLLHVGIFVLPCTRTVAIQSTMNYVYQYFNNSVQAHINATSIDN